MPYKNNTIRNVAIIAHVDHGKTTLVNSLINEAGLLKNNLLQDRVMDRMELEKERGITIAAKNCALTWKDVKINIIDTPGHADFGGEVERGLSMADGALLLVDAAEGPLPQTRFVLSKALAASLSIIIVINKVDRSDARPKEVLNEIYDLLIDLGGDESLLDVPVFYANGRDGKSSNEPINLQPTLEPILNAIIKDIPAPSYQSNTGFQMLVSDLSYNDYLGRLAIGKVINGSVSTGEPLLCIGKDNKKKELRLTKLQSYNGITMGDINKIEAGDIAILAGIEDVEIGDTICTSSSPFALPRIEVDEPTVAMYFYKNDSPLSGREGKIVQTTKIWERLQKETLTNLSLKVEKDSTSDGFIVKGRGEFQMAILVETMRREGFELSIGRPHIIYHYDENGKKLEPIEHLVIDCQDEYSGTIMEKLSKRKATLLSMDYNVATRVRMEFELPSRALIGYRDEFLSDTRGTGLMSSYLLGYQPYRGDFSSRSTGSLISDREGHAVAYAIFNLEPRGSLFISPGDQIYQGMVVGEHNKENDLMVNPSKEKKLTNMRAAAKDEAIILTPPVKITLEKAIQFIKEDELVEVTPTSIRIRKRILDEQQRKIAQKQKSL